MRLRPSSHVRPRAFVSLPACSLGRLLVREADGGVGGGCFAIDGASVAVFDGEAVVCGAPAVNARVEGNGCGVALDGGVECVGAGFAASAPVAGVCGGFARVCSRAVVALFNHGLGCACASGLFAGVLCARVGDPCVGNGAKRASGRGCDGGGVSACWSVVVALVVVQGCVDGDNAVVRVARALALVRACECACVITRECVSCECEHAATRCHDGFTDQHVGERLLFALHPFVDLALRERYADGGEWLAPVARGGEGAGGDVGVSRADGGGHGFALVEEDEGEARDGACVAHVGVEVGALDDTPVGFRARLHERVLVAVVCARSACESTRGIAVAERDGEVGAVAECDDVAVVALHVAAVEELVEVGGELALVADGVLCGARWSKAVFDVVPHVHCWFLFLSVASRLFSCTVVACSSRVRERFLFLARFPVRHGIMGVIGA